MASWSTYLQWFGYLVLLCFFVPIRIRSPPSETEEKFVEYLKKFNKTYDDPAVYQTRLEAFQKSLETIERLNSNRSNNSAVYGLTKYSDMLPEEFLKTHLQSNISQRFKNKHHKRRAINDLPQKIDWRNKSVVTKIKNQENCGACWAFSAVESVESMYAIKYGKLIDLSVQQMIDCAGYENRGCKGGDVCTLLSWLKDFQIKINRNQDYQGCEINSNFTGFGVQIEDFACENLVDNENVILELLVKNGPVTTAINAQVWQNYIGGVITYHCDGDFSQLNHAVQIVGYDLTAKIPFYIVRNTWGGDFGDGGYLYIAIGKNMCGLANEVSALSVL